MWRVELIILALSVIKELLKFLRDKRKAGPVEQKSILLGVKSQIVRQSQAGEAQINIVV